MAASTSTTSHDTYLTPPDSAPESPTKASPPSNAFSQYTSVPAPRSRPSSTSKSYFDALLSLPDAVLSTISTISFPPLIAACRMAIVSMMSHSIAYGQLRVLTANHGVYSFPGSERRKELGMGDVKEGDKAEIRVIRDTFWLRLVTLGDLGFAEAYMAGDCEVSDLVQVFKIFIRSRPALQQASSNISGVSTIPSRLFSLVTSLTNSRFANTLSNSISNIRAHYDLSNGMFSAFLSRDMTYSCAIFPELDGDLERGIGRMEGMNGGMGLKKVVNGRLHVESEAEDKGEDVDELYDAQIAKLRHIIKKADIQVGHRVLEIGSGWGSLAIEAVKTTGCTVDTITLSEQQKQLAEERIKDAGLTGRIRVWLMDYRALPESWKGSFDRVVSIEMLEAVGKEFIAGYFGVINSVLNQGGVACVQVITIPESRFDRYQREVDFIRKWIFPGGFLPTVSFAVEAIRVGADNGLVVDSISNIGPHYARTLREWRRRFLAAFDHRIAPAMRAEHPDMTDEDLEVFKRKWIYYFCYCEVGFTERVLGDHIITMVREGNAEYGCNVYS